MNALLTTISIYAAKSAIVLLFAYGMYRVLGKREAGQMTAYDIVMIVCLSNAVQNAMTEGKGELVIGLTAAASLVATAALVARLAARSKRAYRIIIGQPTVLINKGQVQEATLTKQNVTSGELMVALRQHGLTDLSQVSMAVLEVDGSVSIVPADQDASPPSGPNQGSSPKHERKGGKPSAPEPS